MPNLTGKVAIVTGAGRGIGRGHALALAAAGAKIVVNDLGGSLAGEGSDLSPAQQVVEEIRAAGGEAVADGENVADFAGAGRLVQHAVDEFGQLDILVNNAGILRDRMLVNMTEAEWDAVINVHLKGHFAPTQHAAVHWRERSKAGEDVRARVICTSSPSGVFGNVGQANYGAAKAGIAAFTIIASQELGRYGVTVNCIAPNARTRMTEQTFEMDAPGDGFDPLDPANNSVVVVALCADEAQGITGQVFHVWGGAVNALQGWSAGELFKSDDGWDADALLGAAPGALPGRRRASRNGGRHSGRGRDIALREVKPPRRRIYLMRHAQVRYFEGVRPEQVVLTDEGRRQAQAAAAALAGVRFDRVLTSGLPRTLETARIVAPGIEPEEHPALREIESGDIRGLDPDEVQAMMTTAFRGGVVPRETPFLGGETIGALLDRVLPELDELVADETWDVVLLVLHGAVNRAILGRAVTGENVFLGAFEQAPACINVLDLGPGGEFVVRAVNHTAYDPAHVEAARVTTMEQLWGEYLEARRQRAASDL